MFLFVCPHYILTLLNTLLETKKPAKKSPIKKTPKAKPKNLKSELNKPEIKSNTITYDSESNDETQSHAQQAIQRWKEKQLLSQGKFILTCN